MKPPSMRTKKAMQYNAAEALEERRRQTNAQKARKAADTLFPGEKWNKVDDGIYVSQGRKTGEKSNYKDEKRDAEILQSFGGTVFLTPENSRTPGKKYDAIVNGERMEFKNIGGNANTLAEQFLKSRSQAPNVFINLEESDLTKHEIITALYGARNSPRYAYKNGFSGGKIILNIKGNKNLVYINVESLKITRKKPDAGASG